MNKTRHGENKNKSINNIFVLSLVAFAYVGDDTKIDLTKRRNCGFNILVI
jgi:hypothetical protein